MILFATLVATAAACGGFFCSRAQPVVQAGENILFTMDGLDVTATIQIQYTGDASKFSWVLPLPSDPTAFGVASDQLFRALHQFTAPQFSLTVNYPANCSNWKMGAPCPIFRDFAAGNPVPASAPGVNIVAMGEVGPYEYTVITALASDPMGDALFSWLNANGFDQPPSSKPIVARYVGLKHRFVTLKLQKGKSSGELVPIVLKYKSPSSTAMSCVPLRLTAIAASDEMPVFVWIAGKERAVPQNFVHIKPDFAALPWEQCAGSNDVGGWRGGFIGGAGLFRPFGGGNPCENEYKSLLKQTAEKFGAGKWLTTEFAGERPKGLLDAVWNTATPQVDIARLETFTTAESFLQQLMNALPFDLRTSPITLELIRKHVPKPDNVDANCMSDQAYYSPFNNQCLSKYLKSFNGKAFTNDIQQLLLQPIIDSRNQLEKFSYITRLYTLMTPINMVRDPVFRFVDNADTVSNVITANFTIDCPSAPDAATTGTVLVGDSQRKVSGVTPGSCGGFSITKPTPIDIDVGKGVVIELLQEDDKAPKKLKRTALADLAAVQAQDALLNDIDGSIFGTPITASCGNCNCGSIGCGCMTGNMCMSGAKCESDSVGVKKCVASAVKPDESSSLRSASLAVTVATLAALLLCLH